MKSLKKLICLLLALVMIFAASAETFAFGIKSLRDTEKPVYKVVSVGDSTAVGIGLNDLGIYGINDFTYGSYVNDWVEYFANIGFVNMPQNIHMLTSL